MWMVQGAWVQGVPMWTEGVWGVNAGACKHGHRWPRGHGGWSEGHHSPCVREIGMCVLWGCEEHECWCG